MLNTKKIISNKVKSNNKIITEATTLNKKEEAITDPKELEPIIERWEKAVSGEEPIINKKTNEPVSEKYFKEKLSLLKKKLEQLKSGASSDDNNTFPQACLFHKAAP